YCSLRGSDNLKILVSDSNHCQFTNLFKSTADLPSELALLPNSYHIQIYHIEPFQLCPRTSRTSSTVVFVLVPCRFPWSSSTLWEQVSFCKVFPYADINPQ